jgi:TRAP-type uncharacterized transport system fused permease subunit
MVLGMGMPTTAVYVLLAALVAPGLSKLGDCTHCRPLVHLLLRDAEHDHAAGLFGELSGWSDQTNSFALLAATGLLIPIVQSGKFAVLTWASNSIGLALPILLVSAEWLARSSRDNRRRC